MQPVGNRIEIDLVGGSDAEAFRRRQEAAQGLGGEGIGDRVGTALDAARAVQAWLSPAERNVV